MMLKDTRFIWLAALAFIMASTLARAEDAKQVKVTKTACKSSCKAGSSDVVCDIEIIATPGCGTAKSLEILGRLAGTSAKKACPGDGCAVAESCACSDACKCGASCKCSDSAKCHPSCKCSSAKKASENVGGKATKVAKKGCCSKRGKCASKACCTKKSDVAKKKCESRGKKKDAACKQRVVGKPGHPRVPHRPVFAPHRSFPSPPWHPNPAAAGVARCQPAHVLPHHPGHVAVPHHPGHVAVCRDGEAHSRQLHERLVKLLAENAELKAKTKLQQHMMEQQKQHHKQILETQAQMLRLQAQVELVSRREEIRDQLVAASAELAHAEILMEIAQEHPDAFVKMMRGDETNHADIGKNSELQAVKAENAGLQAKIAKLENHIKRLIEHTAKQHRGPKLRAR